MSDPDDAVRRLLAEARHDGPVPPEVAERLDVLLGRLVEERTRQGRSDDLARRRSRRQRAGVFLAAAAAAVVVGVAVPQVLPGGGSGGDSASTASDSEAAAGATEAGSAQPYSTEDQPEDQAGPGDLQAQSGLPLGDVLVLTSTGFDREVRAATAPPVSAYESRLSLFSDTCRLPPEVLAPGSDARVATYDGADAALLVSGTDPRRAALYLCGRDAPVRTLDLPPGVG